MISLLLATNCLVVFQPVYGQVCYPAEITEAVGSFLKLPPPAQFHLRVTEVPRLKDELLGLQVERLGTSAVKVVDFYEVTPATYQLVNSQIVSVTVQLDNDSVWVVGFGPNKTIYQLAGFSSPASSFNKLISDVGIEVNDSETALDVLWLFLKLTQGREFLASIIGDSMQLQGVAVQDFRLRFPESQRLGAYNNWWKRVPRHLKNEIAAPKVQSRQNLFEVIYYRYNEGRIKLETGLIKGDGSVTLGASKTVYE